MHEAWVLLVEFGFKVHRGLITKGAVEPLAVVKDFNPFKDGGFGLGASGKLTTVNQLAFKAAPEAFHGGVVVAVARAAHAGDDAGLRQPLAVGGTAILNAAIGVMHQAFRRL